MQRANNETIIQRVSAPFENVYSGLKNAGKGVCSAGIKILNAVVPVNPVSKKRQLRVLPTVIEKFLGEVNYDKLAPSYRQICHNEQRKTPAKYYRIVNEVFEKLVKQSECQDKFDYEVRLIEDSQVNAFCLPGGKTVITTGILNKLNNMVNGDEDKLKSAVAFVMGHELTHANASHAAGTLAFKLTAFFVGFIAGKILGIVIMQKLSKSSEEEIRNNPHLSYQDIERIRRKNAERAYQIGFVCASLFEYVAQATTYLLERVYSRSNEYEADRHSLTYLKRAGIDHEGAITTMKMFKEMRGKPNKVMRFIENVFSTHPSPDKRQEAIEKEIKRLHS